MRKSFYFILTSCCLVGLAVSCDAKKNPLKLWYAAPATDWMREALPLGNGYMGAMVFGGVEREQIQLSEGSLWEGGPGSDARYNFGNRPEAWKAIEPIRQLICQGKMKESDALASKELTGSINYAEGMKGFGDFGANQTAGDLFIEISGEGTVSDYYRDLNISDAVSNVRYTQGTVKHRRTYFASYPQRAFLMKLENNARNGADYVINYASPHVCVKENFHDQTYFYEGHVPFNKLKFQTAIKVMDTDGVVSWRDGTLRIKGAKELFVLLTIATEYENHYPDYRNPAWGSIIPDVLEKTNNKSFPELLQEHVTDYHQLFNRVSLNLGETSNDLPTNERLVNYQLGTSDNALEALFFQYGRYLLISSSRPGTMPANLQGKWNKDTNPPWACDYHTNINMQMIYWPALPANLAECNEPMTAWTASLVTPGKASAKDFFNTRGWIVNTMNNAFGYTAPGWGFPWGFFPGGAAWLCQHSWEHFAFTQDTAFLRRQAFPVMKEAALFWLDYLTEDENAVLVSSPSYSPEHGGISGGASMDHQIVWDLFTNFLKAAYVLGIDDEFTREVSAKRERICPPQIGRWGQLQEWKEDVDDSKSTHRHVSHLFALFPGSQLTPDATPELAEAAKVSLNARGDAGTGWSLAWKVNFWARLKDGNRAYQLLKNILRIPGEKAEIEKGGGVYQNLLATHPPFQLDGNMGACSGMAEMLLQSQNDVIQLLPALPDAWRNGSVKGLAARGGVEVDMQWKHGQLTNATIHAKVDTKITVKYGEVIKTFDCKNGRDYSF